MLEDIHALQCIRDLPRFTKADVMLMARINNHTASIQSRLVGLPNLSPVLECCHLAAYVCSVMLCCTVWCALVIPVGEPQTLGSLSLARLAPVKKALVQMDLTIYQTSLLVRFMNVLTLDCTVTSFLTITPRTTTGER